MKIIVILLWFLGAILTNTGFAEETPTAPPETTATPPPTPAPDSAPTEEQPEKVRRKFFAVNFTQTQFKSMGVEELNYDIKGQLWSEITGSYQFSKRFSGSINARFDSKEVKDSFNLLASVGKENWIFAVTFGKLKGDATLEHEIVLNNSSFVESANDFEAKFFAFEILNKNWALFDGSLFGLRYTNYTMPAEFEINANYGAFNIGSVVPFLDPEMNFQALQVIFEQDTLRNFILSTDDSRGFYDDNGLAVRIGFAAGFGKAQISDLGKSNVQVDGFRTLEKDSDVVGLIDSQMGFSWAWNKVRPWGRMSFGIGYHARYNTLLSFTSFDTIPDPEDETGGAALNAIRLGYLLHGPKFSFYLGW